MRQVTELQIISIKDLKPYKNNARKHAKNDIEAIKQSIADCGFNDPVGIWGDENLIVEGHGRVLAAKELGITELPCIRLDYLTEEQRKEYAIAHNRTAELSTWDTGLLNLELSTLKDVDLSVLKLENLKDQNGNWFDNRTRFDNDDENESDEYKEFKEKFELKKTTDDCYTPDLIYAEVADFVATQYQLPKERFVRPFYPGGTTKKSNMKRAA